MISMKFDHDHYDLWSIAGIIAFPLTALILAPIVHEYAHLITLKFYSCFSWILFDFSLADGVTGIVYHSCELSIRQTLVYNLSGISATFAIASLFLILDWTLTKKDYLEYSVFSTFVGMGFFFSSVTYFFKDKGDIVESLGLLGIEHVPVYLYTIGAVLIAANIVYFILNIREISKDLEKDKDLAEKEKKRKGVDYRRHRTQNHKKYKRPEK